jgi:hypothetical protein
MAHSVTPPRRRVVAGRPGQVDLANLCQWPERLTLPRRIGRDPLWRGVALPSISFSVDIGTDMVGWSKPHAHQDKVDNGGTRSAMQRCSSVLAGPDPATSQSVGTTGDATTVGASLLGDGRVKPGHDRVGQIRLSPPAYPDAHGAALRHDAEAAAAQRRRRLVLGSVTICAARRVPQRPRMKAAAGPDPGSICVHPCASVVPILFSAQPARRRFETRTGFGVTGPMPPPARNAGRNHECTRMHTDDSFSQPPAHAAKTALGSGAAVPSAASSWNCSARELRR